MAARAAILTVSTSRAAGEGEDLGGPRLAALAERLGLEIVGRETIPDERSLIEARLRHWSDVEDCALILTTGAPASRPATSHRRPREP